MDNWTTIRVKMIVADEAEGQEAVDAVRDELQGEDNYTILWDYHNEFNQNLVGKADITLRIEIEVNDEEEGIDILERVVAVAKDYEIVQAMADYHFENKYDKFPDIVIVAEADIVRDAVPYKIAGNGIVIIPPE